MSSAAGDTCDLVASIWEGVASENNPYRWAALTLVAAVLLTFFTSVASDNYSQVDKLWSIIPVIYAWIAVCDSRTLLMACLVTVWSIRLTYNFARRGGYKWPPWEGDEDYRWEVIRAGGFLKILTNPVVWTIFNFAFISLYQNVLLLWITAPSFVAYTMATTPACAGSVKGRTSLGVSDLMVAALFLALVLVESVADNQQYAFQTEKYRRKAAGEALTGDYADGFRQSGLFSIVRKPNYAAEQSIWITFYLFSLVAVGSWWNWSGWGFLQLILLFQQSGQFTEKITLTKYPKYADYMARFPLYAPNPFYGKRRNPKES